MGWVQYKLPTGEIKELWVSRDSPDNIRNISIIKNNNLSFRFCKLDKKQDLTPISEWMS